MRKYDIVYILRANTPARELRYSLRSIEKNMDHGKVWFYCGCPDGFVPDEHVPQEQRGASKWERVRSSLVEVCKNDKISKQFWLFNDDFYVMKPMQSAKNYHRGLLADHIKDIEQRHCGGSTAYTRNLRMCEQQLREAGLTTLDYAIHIPMLVDREKALEALRMFPRCPMFRSIYGNHAQIGGDFIKDCKTTDCERIIDANEPFFSTSNRAMAGRVLEQMEKLFPDPCRYEEEYDADQCDSSVL